METKNEEKGLTLEEILAANDQDLLKIEVPEWKGHVYLKPMSAKRAMDYNRLMSDPAHRHDAVVRMVASCLCDAQGNLLVTPDKLEEFRTRNWRIFQHLGRKCLEINGLLDNEKVAKELVEQVKNA